MQTVLQPGPIRESRMDLVACQGREIEVTLADGIALEEAVARALAPLEAHSAWLELVDASVTALSYVLPAEAPDDAHVAWYSDPERFERGEIKALGMIVGVHNGVSFLHGHGTWAPEGGAVAMGHILAPQTVLAAPAKARGIALFGAEFSRRHDAETNFELFHVDHKAHTDGGYAALRLLPNQDLQTGLDAACAALGWSSARVHGIGSVNMPRFDDGRALPSRPTEFLVRDAMAGAAGEAGPDVVIVGKENTGILTGRLSRGENSVLVTAELVLKRSELQ